MNDDEKVYDCDEDFYEYDEETDEEEWRQDDYRRRYRENIS